MRYDEFRDAFSEALEVSGLHSHVGNPIETIDLGTMNRRWKTMVAHVASRRGKGR